MISDDQGATPSAYAPIIEKATVKTEIIGHHAGMLELRLLVRSVSQVRAERESSRGVFPPNPEGEILGVLAPCPIILVFTGTLLIALLQVKNCLSVIRIKTPAIT